MEDEAAQLPIDIHSGKLLEWLVSRRHCNRDWQKIVLTIREKISSAINDMPEDNRILSLLQGNYINYFHCVEIVKILQETEKDTKNLFGYYSSQRMNDWLEIKRLYERNNVFLAEAAEILQRMVQYEIPYLKKQITKCNQTIMECDKKEKDYLKQAEDSRRHYSSELSKLRLKGTDVRNELISSVVDSEIILDHIIKEILKLDESIEYYEDFRTYAHRGNSPSSKILPILRLLLKKKSNCTAYEWIHGVEPKSVQQMPLPFATTDKTNVGEDEIDFGDAGAGDVSVEQEIDFRIELVDDDDKEKSIDGLAQGLEALSVLENRQTQRLLIYELKELHSFLLMRKANEINEVPSDMYLCCLENRPPEITKVTIKQIESWLNLLDSILQKFSDIRNVHLFKLRASPQYGANLIVELDKKRALEDRYKHLANLMIDRQKETHENLKKAQFNLDVVFKSTRELQKQVEETISKKYNGRKVNIMGGIAAALAPMS